MGFRSLGGSVSAIVIALTFSVLTLSQPSWAQQIKQSDESATHGTGGNITDSHGVGGNMADPHGVGGNMADPHGVGGNMATPEIYDGYQTQEQTEQVNAPDGSVEDFMTLGTSVEVQDVSATENSECDAILDMASKLDLSTISDPRTLETIQNCQDQQYREAVHQ